MITDLIASFRAEWLKLWKRPGTWVLGVVLAGLLLAVSYGFVLLAVLLVTHSSSPNAARLGANIQSLEQQLYPAGFLSTALSAFAGGFGYGNAIALILGALAYGSEFGSSTLKTVFTQRPGRLTTYGGKLLALALVLAIYAAAVLAAAAAISALLGVAYGHLTPWPSALDLVRGFLSAWLLMGLWSALGILLAVVFRQSALAIGLGIVYAIAIEGLVLNTLSVVASLDNLQRVFPGENGQALVQSFGPNAGHALVGPVQAVLVVAGYLVLFLLISGFLLRRRDVT
jgi:ABC-2 type transport system permease protein